MSGDAGVGEVVASLAWICASTAARSLILPVTMSFWHRSLTGRALVFTAAAVGVVIAATTVATYVFVFKDVEARGVVYLNQYVSERAKREEQNFLRIRDSLYIARQAFLERWKTADPPGYLDRFDRLFARDPDGAVRSRREFGDNFKYPTLWIHKDRPLTDEFKRRLLVLYDTTALFLPIWIHSLGSLYAITPDTANIGFEAALPNWVYDAPADLDQDNMDYVKLLDQQNNPKREMKWLAPGYVDPTTGLYFVTLALPVDVDGRHLATFGHDMVVADLFQKTVQTDIAGLTHMVLREDGRVIAHPAMMKQIIDRKGMFAIEDSNDPAFVSLCRAMFAAEGREIFGYDAASDSYYAATRLQDPAWIFASTMPRSVLTAQAFESTQWVLWAGLLSLGLELALLALILQRQIARPMRTMLAATARLAAGESQVPLPVTRLDELGTLTSGFNDMVLRVQERDDALREEKARLEEHVHERTAELVQALTREKEASDMKSDFVSIVSHEFRTPLEVIMSSGDILDRYFDRLTPEQRATHLSAIHESVRRMDHLMSEVLLLSTVEAGKLEYAPVPTDLAALCRRYVDEILSATSRRNPIVFTEHGSLAHANADESVLRHIFINLLGNAVKYSAPGEPVHFDVARDGRDAVCCVQDHGCGIPPEDRDRIFQAFHRARNARHVSGTGLGLVIVKRCVDLHGGTVGFETEENRGTVFTVRLPLFADGSPT